MAIKLSIITICYNEKDIENTCLSIVNQTWQDFEWIVIDGGSASWCTDILEKYREQMAFYVSEKDGGRYEAMNKGIPHAKGEYLLFMNAGDSLHDEAVLHDVFVKNQYSADIIYGNEKLIRRDDTYKIFGGQRDFDKKAFWLVYYNLRHQASFIKKSLFDSHGLYNTDYRSAADFERFLRFIYLEKCSVQFMDRFISIFKLFDGISTETDHIGSQELFKINLLTFGKRTHFVKTAKRITNAIVLLIPSREKRHNIRKAIINFAME